MLSTANITMQFGAKPLFENVSVKFGDGNRYGLIGANGCGKSTFMKILGGDLEQIAAEDFHKGGFAAPVRADQPVTIAVAEFYGDVFKQGFRPELHGDVSGGK